jgi:FMN phosphatase YigB (HAD superfamily)
MRIELIDILDNYNTIVFDFGGVLHDSPLNNIKTKEERTKVIQELKDLEAVLSILSYDHPLVILSNSPKQRIEKILEKAEIKRYFKKIYGGTPLQSKVNRLNKIKKEFGNNNIILLDDNLRNIKQAHDAGIPAMQIFYEDLF